MASPSPDGQDPDSTQGHDGTADIINPTNLASMTIIKKANLGALKDQLTSKDARIQTLEHQLLTQTALGEVYFQWGQESDVLLHKAMRLLRAKGRETRKLEAEVLSGKIVIAKMGAVAEVLDKLSAEEGVVGGGGGVGGLAKGKGTGAFGIEDTAMGDGEGEEEEGEGEGEEEGQAEEDGV